MPDGGGTVEVVAGGGSVVVVAGTELVVGAGAEVVVVGSIVVVESSPVPNPHPARISAGNATAAISVIRFLIPG